MDPFPFTESDWQRVDDAARAVTNATLMEDDALAASCRIELLTLLIDLRGHYGDHPVLFETEADFLDEPDAQVRAYERALRIASLESLPTLSIRISLARVLIEDFGNTERARRELASCHAEMVSSTDDYERREWAGLMDQCRPRSMEGTDEIPPAASI